MRNVLVMLSVILVFFPFQVLANSSTQDAVQSVVVSMDTDRDIELYEEHDDASDVLTHIPTGTELTILDIGEQFSHVTFVDDEDVEWEGYVKNQFIKEDLENSDEDTNRNDDTDKNIANNHETTIPDQDKKDSQAEVTDKETAKLTPMKRIDIDNLNVEDFQFDIKGITLKEKTHVYEKDSVQAKVLKTYAQGKELEFAVFNEDWYITRVNIDGKSTFGYIHVDDVEDINAFKPDMEGMALQEQTKVYAKTSTKANVLKSYAQRSMLEFAPFNDQWYKARVYVDGEPTIGFIHADDVENVHTFKPDMEGMALQKRTKVYAKTSTKANVLKSYAQRSMLEFAPFNDQWYKARVYVDGEPTIGFIHADDVENVHTFKPDMEGMALQKRTKVYAKTSTKANVLKSYAQRSMLEFASFNNQWYKARVYVDGEPTIGFIHVDDVSLGDTTAYDLTLEEAVNIQMKTTPQTDKEQAWVSKKYIKNGKVTASALNVRTGPGTKHKSIGYLYKGDSVDILDEYNGWYSIKYKHSTQWVHANPGDLLYYLDPNNFIHDNKQKFQFLDLTKPSGASKSTFNKYLKGKGTLEGKGQAFIEAGRKHGINDAYLLSHALHETGNGTSKLARGVKYKGTTVYNMYGIGANDGCAVECGAKKAYEEGWTTPEKAIIDGAAFVGNNFIKSGQNTLYKMRWNPEAMEKNGEASHQYATDIGWASKQINTMYDLYQSIDDYLLRLDIPVYKDS